MKTLTIIAPVYNEEDVIEQFYNALKLQLDKLLDTYDSKILFVLDKSQDKSLDILSRIGDRDKSAQVLALSSRFGHQMSLLAGIDNTDSDLAIMMDSDLQHPPEIIPTLLQEFEKGYDVVNTTRMDIKEIGFLKRITSRWFYNILTRISEIPIRESSADFRLLNKKVLNIIKTQIRERNLFLRGMISWIGFSQTSIPFYVKERSGGKSKYSLGRLIQFGLNGVVSFSKKPLQAAIYVGVLFAFLGFIFALVTITQYFFDDTFPAGWATLVVVFSVFSGVQLIFLGIIGEYIGAIFDEVKGRPHYIIEEKINI